MVKFVVIDESIAGQRIDNFLFSSLKGVPKSRIYRGLRKGEFRVNSGRVTADYRLGLGDRLRLPPLRVTKTATPKAPPARLLGLLESRVIYEDKGLLVLNKPSGLPVHGGTGTSWGLIELVQHVRPQKKWPLKLVHRLDRETSGCLLIAKKRSILLEWHERLANRQVKKHYSLLVKGKWPDALCQVDSPLRKNTLRSGERMVTVDADGKPAVTRFFVQSRFQGSTLLTAHLITGRTHQIRVHALSAGHPLAGDDKYGDSAFNQKMRAFGLTRLFLHCSQLGGFSSKLDEDLERVLECVGNE